MSVAELFTLRGKVAVITGATGVLGSAMARGVARAGARVGILGRRLERAREIAAEIEAAGGEAIPLRADVLVREELETCREAVEARWNAADILVNVAGGNLPQATVADGGSFFDIPLEAWRSVLDLNLLGTLLPIRVFGAAMAGDNSLFAREDYVEEAWRIVDPVLKKGTPIFPYAPNTWGPAEVARVMPPGGWDTPVRGPDNLLPDG